MFQQKKMQLSRREEQCGENVEQTQHPEIGKMIADAKAIENDLRKVNSLWVKVHISQGLILVGSLQFCVVLDKYLWLAENYQEKKSIACQYITENTKACGYTNLRLAPHQWIESRKIKFK